MAGLSTSMQELDEPLLAVGKSNTIIQVLPSALRFWDKLGLTPRAGKKDLNAFVLYDGGEEKEQQLASWLDRVSAAYDVSRHVSILFRKELTADRPRDSGDILLDMLQAAFGMAWFLSILRPSGRHWVSPCVLSSFQDTHVSFSVVHCQYPRAGITGSVLHHLASQRHESELSYSPSGLARDSESREGHP